MTTSDAGTNPAERSERLSRNVKVLGAVSLAQDTGSEMLYPLLPSFVTGILGAPVVALATARGRAFGYHCALDTIGAILGPLLGLLL